MSTQRAALTLHEIKVLQMVGGQSPVEWGAWVHQCLEVLRSRGYVEGPDTRLTAEGEAYLAEMPK